MDIPNKAIEMFTNGASDLNPNDFKETSEVSANSFGSTDSAPAFSVQETPVQEDTSDDEDELVIAGVDTTNMSAPETSMAAAYSEIIAKQLGNLKNDDKNHYDSISEKLLNEIKSYRHDLIVNEGLTPEEADKAAKNRAFHSAKEEYQRYYSEHPEVAVIEVPAGDANKITFTKSQQEKLDKSKRIHMIEVEDQTLKVLKIKETDRKDIARILHKTTCSISNYSLPFYNTRDYLTFKGANILRLNNATMGRESLLSLVVKQAQLLYDCFVESTTRTKYDSEGNVIMSYEDFIKWYRFDDMDTGLYAIYVASSTEMITSNFTCRQEACLNTLPPDKREQGREYPATYNSKSIISFDEAEEKDKAIIDAILANKDSLTKMEKFQEGELTQWRMESSYTKNIYEFAIPSISDAIVTYENTVVDPDTEEGMILSYAMWTRAIYVYDGEENGEAVYYKLDDINDIVTFYHNIIETERQLINTNLSDKLFKPEFRLTTRCPNCGHERTMDLLIRDLVFLRARSIEAAIS